MSWESCIKGYFKEREDFTTLGSEQGFITFKDQGDGSFYIRDLYVVPDFRKTNVATEMALVVEERAKAAGAFKIYGTVSPLDPGADRNIRVLHGYGMKFVGVNQQGNLLFEKGL
jgi:GNAT superfamily N-acetyltransferase